jgi:hypothetical protein
LNRSLLNKLLLARRLYELARENLSTVNDLSLSIGVNLLQDAVEVFLLAVSEHVNAGIQGHTHFDKYFELIDAKIGPKELPFRARLIALNKLRVNSKHYGLAPAQSETEGLLVTVREFFDEVARSVLNLSFTTLSLIDLVRDGEAKEMLRAAELAFQNDAFEQCLIDCRKAIFLRVERPYDVAPFSGSETSGLLGLGSHVPIYATNREYNEEHVRDATDYIVLDFSALELELVTSGMDSISFWNVWTLTPEVYRSGEESEWVVKWDLRKLDAEDIKERAEYVLTTTVNLFVAADQRRASIRHAGHRAYKIALKEDNVPIFEKADVRSRVVGRTPQGVRELRVDFSVPALNGDGSFWHVTHHTDEWSLWGYLSAESVAE